MNFQRAGRMFICPNKICALWRDIKCFLRNEIFKIFENAKIRDFGCFVHNMPNFDMRPVLFLRKKTQKTAEIQGFSVAF